MRADARRNHDSVLEAGARLLAERPSASMQEIADASGVGRTTVYRHFPAREDLVVALVERVAEEVTAVSASAVAIDRPAEDVIRRLSYDMVALGRRWRFLRDQLGEVRASLTDSDIAWRDWVVQAQRRGDLRDDWPADWVLAITRGLITEAITEADTIGAERASQLLSDTLITSLSSRP
jgi:AcrR family transcriptional regulator